MQEQIPVVTTTLDWVSNHLNLLGWPSLLWFAIRASWKSSRYISLLESRAANVETTIGTIRDNHLLHIQTGIDSLNAKIEAQTTAIVTELSKTRSDLLLILAAKKD